MSMIQLIIHSCFVLYQGKRKIQIQKKWHKMRNQEGLIHSFIIFYINGYHALVCHHNDFISRQNSVNSQTMRYHEVLIAHIMVINSSELTMWHSFLVLNHFSWLQHSISFAIEHLLFCQLGYKSHEILLCVENLLTPVLGMKNIHELQNCIMATRWCTNTDASSFTTLDISLLNYVDDWIILKVHLTLDDMAIAHMETAGHSWCHN